MDEDEYLPDQSEWPSFQDMVALEMIQPYGTEEAVLYEGNVYTLGDSNSSKNTITWCCYNKPKCQIKVRTDLELTIVCCDRTPHSHLANVEQYYASEEKKVMFDCDSTEFELATAECDNKELLKYKGHWYKKMALVDGYDRWNCLKIGCRAWLKLNKDKTKMRLWNDHAHNPILYRKQNVSDYYEQTLNYGNFISNQPKKTVPKVQMNVKEDIKHVSIPKVQSIKKSRDKVKKMKKRNTSKIRLKTKNVQIDTCMKQPIESESRKDVDTPTVTTNQLSRVHLANSDKQKNDKLGVTEKHREVGKILPWKRTVEPTENKNIQDENVKWIPAVLTKTGGTVHWIESEQNPKDLETRKEDNAPLRPRLVDSTITGITTESTGVKEVLDGKGVLNDKNINENTSSDSHSEKAIICPPKELQSSLPDSDTPEVQVIEWQPIGDVAGLELLQPRGSDNVILYKSNVYKPMVLNKILETIIWSCYNYTNCPMKLQTDLALAVVNVHQPGSHDHLPNLEKYYKSEVVGELHDCDPSEFHFFDNEGASSILQYKNHSYEKTTTLASGADKWSCTVDGCKAWLELNKQKNKMKLWHFHKHFPEMPSKTMSVDQSEAAPPKLDLLTICRLYAENKYRDSIKFFYRANDKVKLTNKLKEGVEYDCQQVWKTDANNTAILVLGNVYQRVKEDEEKNEEEEPDVENDDVEVDEQNIRILRRLLKWKTGRQKEVSIYRCCESSCHAVIKTNYKKLTMVNSKHLHTNWLTTYAKEIKNHMRKTRGRPAKKNIDVPQATWNIPPLGLPRGVVQVQPINDQTLLSTSERKTNILEPVFADTQQEIEPDIPPNMLPCNCAKSQKRKKGEQHSFTHTVANCQQNDRFTTWRTTANHKGILLMTDPHQLREESSLKDRITGVPTSNKLPVGNDFPDIPANVELSVFLENLQRSRGRQPIVEAYADSNVQPQHINGIIQNSSFSQTMPISMPLLPKPYRQVDQASPEVIELSDDDDIIIMDCS